MPGMEQRRPFLLALIPIVLLTAACTSSGDTNAQVGPTQKATSHAVATPRPATAAKDFVSKRYGFHVTLTKAWTEADARSNWDGQKLHGLDAPDFANFTHSGYDRVLVTAAAPVAKGMQLAAWRAAMVRAAPSACTESSSATRTTLGGEAALTWTATCSDGYAVHKLAALHGKRGYMIFLTSTTASDKATNRRIFESIRKSFRFDG
jgi:hypothetical protein